MKNIVVYTVFSNLGERQNTDNATEFKELAQHHSWSRFLCVGGTEVQWKMFDWEASAETTDHCTSVMQANDYTSSVQCLHFTQTKDQQELSNVII